MNWNIIHQLTLGFSFGSFAFLYLIVLFKGVPEAIKAMKSDEKPKAEKTEK
jgi:hypothetical protein